MRRIAHHLERRAARHGARERRHRRRPRFIGFTRNKQGPPAIKPLQQRPPVIIPERPRRGKLRPAPHGVVDPGAETARQRVAIGSDRRRWRVAPDMARIKGIGRRITISLGRRPRHITAVEQVAHRRRHRVLQGPRIVEPHRCRHQRRLQHQSGEFARLARAIFERDRAAPTCAEHMPKRHVQRHPHRLEFLDKSPHPPIRRIVLPLRPAAVELVIEDHRALIGKRCGIEEIPVRAARAAVKHDDRRLAIAQIAIDADIDTPTRHGDAQCAVGLQPRTRQQRRCSACRNRRQRRRGNTRDSARDQGTARHHASRIRASVA